MIWSPERRDVPFEESYQSLLDHAYYVGYRFFSRNSHLAEEVAQETLTRAYERWDTLARHPNREAWVMNAAWKVCMEVHRRQARSPGAGWAPGESRGEDMVVERPQLVAALTQLTTRQRTVALARYYFDYDVAETAFRLGMSESQVRTASLEATRRLRGLLAEATTPAMRGGHQADDATNGVTPA